MNTTPEQLRLAADIIENGWEWEYQLGETWLTPTCFNPFDALKTYFEIRRKPLSFPPTPEGMTLHNPDGLTAEQVGDGYRLITDKEFERNKDVLVLQKEIEAWIAGDWDDTSWTGTGSAITYRVPISTPFPDGSRIVDGKLVKPWVPKFKVGDRVQSFDGKFKGPISLINHTTKTFLIEGCSLDWNDETVTPAPWSLTRHIPGFRPLRDGEEFHRHEDWKENMLPSGYRPVLIGGLDTGEYEESGDNGKTWSVGLFPDAPLPNFKCGFFRTRRPLPEPPKLVPWDDTSDFPKVPTIWIRSKNDYRERMVIGFAHPCAIITVTCGSGPVLQSIHLTQDGFKNMEWSEDRKDWQACSKIS